MTAFASTHAVRDALTDFPQQQSPRSPLADAFDPARNDYYVKYAASERARLRAAGRKEEREQAAAVAAAAAAARKEAEGGHRGEPWTPRARPAAQPSAPALATAQGQGQEEGLLMPHTDADVEKSPLDDAVTGAIATVIDGDGDGDGGSASTGERRVHSGRYHRGVHEKSPSRSTSIERGPKAEIAVKLALRMIQRGKLAHKGGGVSGSVSGIGSPSSMSSMRSSRMGSPRGNKSVRFIDDDHDDADTMATASTTPSEPRRNTTKRAVAINLHHTKTNVADVSF
jgi:hypothetical protein